MPTRLRDLYPEGGTPVAEKPAEKPAPKPAAEAAVERTSDGKPLNTAQMRQAQQEAVKAAEGAPETPSS